LIAQSKILEDTSKDLLDFAVVVVYGFWNGLADCF